MNTYKKTGRTVGFLFLMIFILGAGGSTLRGISTAIIESPDFLTEVLEKALQMRISIALDSVANGLGVGIAILLFPLLTKHDERIPLWYLGLWVVQFTISMVSNISHLSLISLSEQFAITESVDSSSLQALGILKVQDFIGAHLMSLVAYSSGAILFFYLLYREKLVPRLLSLWGMGALAVVFITTWLQIFDQRVSLLLYLQNGLHFLIFTIWLMVKGFQTPLQQRAPEISPEKALNND